MKSFQSGLFGIFLMMIAIIYPLRGNLDDSSFEKLQQIMALTDQKTEKTRKNKNFAQQIYGKAKKIAKKPYVKKIFYGSICVALLMIATYSSYDALLMESIKEPTVVPYDKKLKSLADKDQEKVVPKSNPVLQDRPNSNQLTPKIAPDQVSIQADHQDNKQNSTPPIIEQKATDLNASATIDEPKHSSPINPVILQDNNDLQHIMPIDRVDESLPQLLIKEPDKVDDIEAKKKRYFELRCADDLDFDEYQEWVKLRNEFAEKGLL